MIGDRCSVKRSVIGKHCQIGDKVCAAAQDLCVPRMTAPHHTIPFPLTHTHTTPARSRSATRSSWTMSTSATNASSRCAICLQPDCLFLCPLPSVPPLLILITPPSAELDRVPERPHPAQVLADRVPGQRLVHRQGGWYVFFITAGGGGAWIPFSSPYSFPTAASSRNESLGAEVEDAF